MRRAAAAVLVLLLLLLVARTCARQPCERAERGCRVVFHYEAHAGERLVDYSAPGAPAQAVLGEGSVVSGLEEGLYGLYAGEERTFTVTPENAFGPVDPAAVQDLPRALFRSVGRLEKGMLVMGMREGGPAQGRVVALTSATVRLDFNHALAGKTLVYKVRALEVGPSAP